MVEIKHCACATEISNSRIDFEKEFVCYNGADHLKTCPQLEKIGQADLEMRIIKLGGRVLIQLVNRDVECLGQDKFCMGLKIESSYMAEKIATYQDIFFSDFSLNETLQKFIEFSDHNAFHDVYPTRPSLPRIEYIGNEYFLFIESCDPMNLGGKYYKDNLEKIFNKPMPVYNSEVKKLFDYRWEKETDNWGCKTYIFSMWKKRFYE